LFVDSTGRITNSGSGLQINYNGYSDVTFADPVSSNNIYLLSYTPGNSFFLGSNNGATFNYGWGSASTTHAWHSGSASERMRLDSSGRLGLGTSSPDVKLDVVGAIKATSNLSVGSGGGTSTLTIGNGAVATGAGFINLIASSSFKNWQIASNQYSVGFSIVPSTAAGGTTYTTPAVTIDDSSRVGIGTTSPSTRLDCDGTAKISTTGATSELQILGKSGQGSLIYWGEFAVADRGILGFAAGSGDLVYRRGASTFASGTECFRVDSSSRLLVGTSSSRSLSTANAGTLQIETAIAYATVSITTNSNDASGAYLVLGKSRGVTNGSTTIVANGDDIGGLTFAGADGGRAVAG
jgi:hypothetical protein